MFVNPTALNEFKIKFLFIPTMSSLLSLNSLSTAPIQHNSIDFSDDVVSPQNRLTKNNLKLSHFASIEDTASNTLTTLPDDFQSKLVMMTTEINTLVDTNLQLTQELDMMKMRCKEAEKLIGKSATITLVILIFFTLLLSRLRTRNLEITQTK